MSCKKWIGRDTIDVNSLHGQGIKRLADGLKPEAFAPDGLVEAVRGTARPSLPTRRAVASRVEGQRPTLFPKFYSAASAMRHEARTS